MSDWKFDIPHINEGIKKITPRGDLSWYIKWFSSIVILIGMVLTSIPIVPFNLYFHLIGAGGLGIVKRKDSDVDDICLASSSRGSIFNHTWPY